MTLLERSSSANLRHPPIAMVEDDLSELIAIAFDGLLQDPRSAAALLHEIERADVFDAANAPPGLVSAWCGSGVPQRVLRSGTMLKARQSPRG